MSSGCLWNPYWAVVLSGRHGTGWQSLSNDFLWALVLWPLGPCAIIFGQLACQDVKALCGKGYPTIFYRALGYVHCVQCGCSVIGRCSASVPLRLQAKWVHATVVQLVFLYGEVGEVSGDQSTYFTYFQQFHHQIVSDGGT